MKNYYYILSILCISILFIGCTSKQYDYEVKDLKTYKQDGNHYTSNLPYFDKNIQEELNKKFDERYFKPWHKNKFEASLKDVTWQFKYKNKQTYGDNNRLLKKQWFDKQIDNSNFEKYNTLLKKAITVKNTNLRVFPTESKMFYNPEIPGEEFIILCFEKKDELIKKLEILREDIKSQKIFHPLKEISITVSIGVSFYSKADSIDHFIKMADDKVYEAKTNGRDRLEVV